MNIAKKLPVALTVFLALSAHALVVSDYDTAESDAVLTANGFSWDGVYNINSCSGVAVADHWILTAAHVADDVTSGTVTIGSDSYSATTTYNSAGADLALIYVADVTFDTYYDIGSFTVTTNTVRQGPQMMTTYTTQTALMVGYGTTGTVDTTTTFTAGSTGKGTERWGTNEASLSNGEIYTYEVTANGYTSTDVIMDFNTADTTYEAGVGTGDSGGGVFVQNADSGEWELAGIMNSSLTGTDQDYVGAVQLSEYSDWITSTMATVIPEPTTIAIFGTGMFGLLGYRRRRQWLNAFQFQRKHKDRVQSGERPLAASHLITISNPWQKAPQTAPKPDRIGDWLVKMDRILRTR
jgi:hypothetical protein